MTKADIHPEHVSLDWIAATERLTERLKELGISRLSDDLGISYDEKTEGCILYDNLSAYSPRKVLVLTAAETWALADYHLDGHCKCGQEIPQAHYVCRTCLDEALHAYGLCV